jgi:hypothetical protein
LERDNSRPGNDIFQEPSMGTSSVRRAPSTRLWRQAKGAATRYLAPERGGPVTAGEVVARYLAALGEGTAAGVGELAAFRATRRLGQELGAFMAQGALTAALPDRGQSGSAEQPWLAAAQGLGISLAGSGSGLEEAVARAALATVLAGDLPEACPGTAARLVRQFLGTAAFLRLALDLGEPLEASAASYARFRAGLTGLRDLITARAEELDAGPAPGSPQQWQGLEGWSWVTEVMQGLLTHLGAGNP